MILICEIWQSALCGSAAVFLGWMRKGVTYVYIFSVYEDGSFNPFQPMKSRSWYRQGRGIHIRKIISIRVNRPDQNLLKMKENILKPHITLYLCLISANRFTLPKPINIRQTNSYSRLWIELELIDQQHNNNATIRWMRV